MRRKAWILHDGQLCMFWFTKKMHKDKNLYI